MRTIETKRFGTLSILDDSVITFSEGIIGFPRLREFAVLGIEDYLPFLILVSLDNPRICFSVISPDALFPNYDPFEGIDDDDPLGDGGLLIGDEPPIDDDEHVQVYCLVAFVGQPRRPVVNLRNPLIVDVKRMVGAQISLMDPRYDPRTPINLGEILLRSRFAGGA